MSVITVSAIFLAEIIGIANELFRLPYLLVVAVIYAAMLLSESKKQLLLKWVLSLPAFVNKKLSHLANKKVSQL